MTVPRVHLVVYVAEGSGASSHVLDMVSEVIVTHVGDDQAQVEVVDVLTSPEAAEAAEVIATPTIDRLLPLPVRRMVGMPSSAAALARSLLLHHSSPPRNQ